MTFWLADADTWRCAGCYDGKVYVVERSNGSVSWSFQTGGPVKCSACVNPRTGSAYIGSHDHHLYSFDIKVPVVLVILTKLRRLSLALSCVGK